MSNISELAQKAAEQLGWDAEIIEKQWTLETGHFKSDAWLIDHNPAGIKWYDGMTYGTKGIAASDGGHYAHFDDPVEGYVQFVQHNHRYDNVNDSQDPAIEAKTIAKDGWATDPNYAKKIMDISINSDTTAKPIPTPAYKDDHAHYVVEKGDTLSKIALHYHVPLTILERFNLISNPDLIKVGQTLRIPTSIQVRSGDTITEIGRRRNENISVIVHVNDLENANKIYIGQTLWV